MQEKDPWRCTKDNPCPKDWDGRGIHPDAVVVGEQDGWPGGDLENYECPHCGRRWTQELPQ